MSNLTTFQHISSHRVAVSGLRAGFVFGLFTQSGQQSAGALVVYGLVICENKVHLQQSLFFCVVGVIRERGSLNNGVGALLYVRLWQESHVSAITELAWHGERPVGHVALTLGFSWAGFALALLGHLRGLLLKRSGKQVQELLPQIKPGALRFAAQKFADSGLTAAAFLRYLLLRVALADKLRNDVFPVHDRNHKRESDIVSSGFPIFF